MQPVHDRVVFPFHLPRKAIFSLPQKKQQFEAGKHTLCAAHDLFYCLAFFVRFVLVYSMHFKLDATTITTTEQQR